MMLFLMQLSSGLYAFIPWSLRFKGNINNVFELYGNQSRQFEIISAGWGIWHCIKISAKLFRSENGKHFPAQKLIDIWNLFPQAIFDAKWNVNLKSEVDIFLLNMWQRFGSHLAFLLNDQIVWTLLHWSYVQYDIFLAGWFILFCIKFNYLQITKKKYASQFA